MIRIVRSSLDSLTPQLTAPFLNKWGHIALQQHPVLSRLLNSAGQLRAYQFRQGGELVGYVIVKVNKRVLADVFHGPVVLDDSQYTKCAVLLKNALRRSGLIAMRIFPPEYGTAVASLRSHFHWATAIVDLDKDTEKIFAAFNSNHRYGIRQAMKENIEVDVLHADSADEFSAGHRQVYERRGIAHPSGSATLKQAYRGLCALDDEYGFILGIRDRDTGALIAGGIFIRSGNTIHYLIGFSLRIRNLALSHLLLWRAMEKAKDMGCTRFDLHGFSLKEDAQLLAINNFKRWFGSKIHVYPETSIVNLIPGAAQLLHLFGIRL